MYKQTRTCTTRGYRDSQNEELKEPAYEASYRPATAAGAQEMATTTLFIQSRLDKLADNPSPKPFLLEFGFDLPNRTDSIARRVSGFLR